MVASSDSERHLQGARQRLREQRLAGAGGAQEHDIALGKLHIALFGGSIQADALVVVVHGHRKRSLGGILSHHVLAQSLIEFMRRGQIGQHLVGRRHVIRRGGLGGLGRMAPTQLTGLHVAALLEHIGAHLDALAADAHSIGALNHAAHLVGRFAAEHAARVFGVDR